MKTRLKKPDKGDPSEILQMFPSYNLHLHCCRYWWLQHWEFNELSFPYWRIYHNSEEGAVIMYDNKTYQLTPDKIVMIAPNTSYATRLHNYKIPQNGYELKGGRIGSSECFEKMQKEKYIQHFFIHFNIGMPYDNIAPGVFVYDLTDHFKEKIEVLKQHLNHEHTRFTFYANLVIRSLVSDLLSSLPESSWNLISNDFRILEVLSHIETNLNEDLSNISLSNIAGMAPNAFIRLFTKEISTSPQKYVKRKRIDRACVYLHHSNLTIDEVAWQTGFADRYHFSRIFKEITGISPARYKKEFEINLSFEP
ncbi:AraC family transcriptional regulator [Halosquirtibacter laminarini]|uniref:AraC family transcriptional regulator n=1 Tax=Halosquirtibacter laminarini TaxID=3374600 RepID=A0AC61NH57_9BACT|nr:AraC family transcriptional regulator [Prolixibacteraceae bacterium]